jgi:hypothetical protein
MTKLIVTPINMNARGSFRERQKLLRAFAALQDAPKSTNVGAMVSAYDEFEALIAAHAETDDGKTVAEALELASATEFDQLLGALLAKAETVPNPSGAS